MLHRHRHWVTFAALCLVVTIATTSRAADEATTPPSESAAAAPPPAAADEGWVPIFNGTDLTGWTPKIAGFDAGDNYANTFRVKDGNLVISYDDYDGEFKNRF